MLRTPQQFELIVASARQHSEQLKRELRHVDSPLYNDEAKKLARIFRELLRLVDVRLDGLVEQTREIFSPYAVSTAAKLATAPHGIHELMRFLVSSSPRECPPVVQTFVGNLLREHLRAEGTAPAVFVVQPGAEFNYQYVDLWGRLEKMIKLAELAPDPADYHDPDGEPSLRLYVETLGKVAVPRVIVAVSVAGLDREDPLSYPLLAHEIGHVLDFHTSDGVVTESLWTHHLDETERSDAGLLDRLQTCLRELASDLLAARMVGFPYLAALARFLLLSGGLAGGVIDQKTAYPEASFRVALLLEELFPEDFTGHDAVRRFVQDLRQTVGSTTQLGTIHGSAGTAHHQRLVHLVWQILPALRERVAEVVRPVMKPRWDTSLKARLQLLERGLPPYLTSDEASDRSQEEADILFVGWVYHLHWMEQVNRPAHAISNLLDKALELQELQARKREELLPLRLDECHLRPDRRPGVLVKKTIEDELRAAAQGGLAVLPVFREAVQASSLELHLGHWFKLANKSQRAFVPLHEREAREQVLHEVHTEHYVRLDGEFILHPQDFALAVSLEYIHLPSDIMASVDGKSGLGRTGLSIATAAQVAPGFRGAIVLELFNVGTLPLRLVPGMAIAQLVLQRTDADALYEGQFHLQTRP